jgi:hypothetical protein
VVAPESEASEKAFTDDDDEEELSQGIPRQGSESAEEEEEEAGGEGVEDGSSDDDEEEEEGGQEVRDVDSHEGFPSVGKARNAHRGVGKGQGSDDEDDGEGGKGKKKKGKSGGFESMGFSYPVYRGIKMKGLAWPLLCLLAPLLASALPLPPSRGLCLVLQRCRVAASLNSSCCTCGHVGICMCVRLVYCCQVPRADAHPAQGHPAGDARTRCRCHGTHWSRTPTYLTRRCTRPDAVAVTILDT